MKINRITFKVILLVAMIISLSVVSSRMHADVEGTGTCGGASVTIPFTMDALSLYGKRAIYRRSARSR
jgi:hypothetical protein